MRLPTTSLHVDGTHNRIMRESTSLHVDGTHNRIMREFISGFTQNQVKSYKIVIY